MNNAHCYAHSSKDQCLQDNDYCDQQENYEFRGSDIIRIQKSMTLISEKSHKKIKPNREGKKSNSFLLNSKQQKDCKVIVNYKNNTKAIKQLNKTDTQKKQITNKKSSTSKKSLSMEQVTKKTVNKSNKQNIVTDYIVLNEQIYQCDNIEQINQQLICGNSKFYDHQRFIKITMKSQQNIQKYLHGFKDYLKLSKKQTIKIQQMTKQQKTKLYHILKLQSNNQTYKSTNKIFNIQNIIKDAYQKIQKTTQATIKQNPHEQLQIKKWKNIKLHQLMAIHSYLNDQNDESSERIKINTSFDLKLNRKSQFQQLFDKQQHLKSTSVGLKEQQSIQLQKLPSPYPNLLWQKYPQSAKKNIFTKSQISRYLPQNHYLSDSGIYHFLHDLWNYMVDYNLVGQFINKIKQPYGLRQIQKQFLLKNSNEIEGYQWQAFFDAKQKPILKNEIFVELCKISHGKESQLLDEQQKFVYILNKAIFDYLNVQLARFKTDFPFGSYNPLQQNLNNFVYIIDQDNAMQVWDDCIQRIINANKIGLGLLIKSENQDMTNAINKHNDQSFQLYFKNEEQIYIWERMYCLTYRKILQEIMNGIENEIWIEMGKFMEKF